MMDSRWKSFIGLVVFGFTTAFIWTATLIYRYGIQPPDTLLISMQEDLEQMGVWAVLLDIIVFGFILKIIFPHRFLSLKKEKGDMRGS
tara:strand:- start:387 stop:650 length:264 start_codon:yes stop_codon:yes gene_type:complete